MRLLIDNRDPDFLIEESFVEELEEALDLAARMEELEGEYECSLSLVDLEEIRELNRTYRQVDRETDVLSFPLDEEDEDFYRVTGQPVPLGDIVICMDRVTEQAREFGHSEKREILYLTIHSFLHLLGYDHMQEEDKRIMRGREKEIMRALGVFKEEGEGSEDEDPGPGEGVGCSAEGEADAGNREGQGRVVRGEDSAGGKAEGKNLRFTQSLGHALDGILHTAVHERNMRFDLVVAVFVLLAGFFFKLSKVEFALLSIAIFMVLAAETFNTAIEHFCDQLVGDHYQPKIKLAKDAAAGAVLLTAINAIVVGCIIFLG